MSLGIRPTTQSTYETSTSIEPRVLQGDSCGSSCHVSEYYGEYFFKELRHDDYPLHVTTQLLSAIQKGKLTSITQESLDEFLTENARETHYDTPPQPKTMIEEDPLRIGQSVRTFNFAWSFSEYHPKLTSSFTSMRPKDVAVFLMYLPKGDENNPRFEDCEQLNAGIFKEDESTYYAIYTNFGGVEIKKFNVEALNRDLCDRFHNGHGIPITRGQLYKSYP